MATLTIRSLWRRASTPWRVTRMVGCRWAVSPAPCPPPLGRAAASPGLAGKCLGLADGRNTAQDGRPLRFSGVTAVYGGTGNGGVAEYPIAA